MVNSGKSLDSLEFNNSVIIILVGIRSLLLKKIIAAIKQLNYVYPKFFFFGCVGSSLLRAGFL